MDAQELALVAELIYEQRWAALATLRDGAPFASWVAYAPEPAAAGFLLHLSRLSPHTQHLLADGRASLAISQSETGVDDPQTLARISIQGQVAPLAPHDPAYDAARATYLARLPNAEMLFTFPDFVLFRLTPSEARYIGGFARAYTLSPELLRRATHTNSA
jgi:heme iron utilization protein